jgi:MarR family 2-MHQ and catechol resistance regulon transcriptional repressor
VVDKLEKKNFLKRVPSPEDRRITFASITEEGKRFMDDIFPQHQETIARIMGGLPLEELEVRLTQ